jgi:hypothetical protein
MSESLSQAGLPTMRANSEARESLKRLYYRIAATHSAGVFGKTIWAFAAEDVSDVPALPAPVQQRVGRVSDLLTWTEYSDIGRLHMRGWVSAVASALKRKTLLAHDGDSLDMVSTALVHLKQTDWESPAQARRGLSTLKAFTQPTWWTEATPTPTVRRGHDLHFNALYSEQQYRRDAARSQRDSRLLVTDVPGLFLGSARSVKDLARMTVGDSDARMGIAGVILKSLRLVPSATEDLTRSAFLGRIRVAHDLSQTLQLIALCAARNGGRAYATHGDGASVILPKGQSPGFAHELAEANLPLPVVIGSAALRLGVEIAERAAERSLTRIKAAAQLQNLSAYVLTDLDRKSPVPEDIALWREKAHSKDEVEKWMGAKTLRSLRVWWSI